LFVCHVCASCPNSKIDKISFAYNSIMYLPDCWKIWLTSVNPFFHKIFPQTDPPSVDLSVGDIRWHLAAEWRACAWETTALLTGTIADPCDLPSPQMGSQITRRTNFTMHHGTWQIVYIDKISFAYERCRLLPIYCGPCLIANEVLELHQSDAKSSMIMEYSFNVQLCISSAHITQNMFLNLQC